jgi:hypothetical protein
VEAKATPSMAIVNSIFFISVGFGLVGLVGLVGASDLPLDSPIMQAECQTLPSRYSLEANQLISRGEK